MPARTYCRVFVTLRNADLASPASRRFDAAWFEIPLQLEPQREVLFGFPGNGFEGRLDAGETAGLFQGDNTFQRDRRTSQIVPSLTPAVGLEVRIGNEIHNRLGTSTDVGRGWVRLQDEHHGVLAGMRDMASLFPSGFEIGTDRLAVEMFSRQNPQHDLVFAWGAHETREMLFDFTSAGADPERFRACLQYPLMGRCDYERYRTTGAICGEAPPGERRRRRRILRPARQGLAAGGAPRRRSRASAFVFLRHHRRRQSVRPGRVPSDRFPAHPAAAGVSCKAVSVRCGRPIKRCCIRTTSTSRRARTASATCGPPPPTVSTAKAPAISSTTNIRIGPACRSTTI
jgi:hypothetical protein